MSAIHQLAAGINRGDAISNEALVLRKHFRSWGYDGDVFCEPNCVHPDLRPETVSAGALFQRIHPEDVVLLHLSMGSDVNDLFARLPCRKVIRYHNVTPAEYFRTLQPRTADLLARGRAQMRQLAGLAEVNLAVSRYNAAELQAAGYADVQVVPIALDFDHLTGPPDRKTLKAYDDAMTNILFVGRCAPNKAIEDLVRLFGCYQRNLHPNSRLMHVGSFVGMEPYYGIVRIEARNLGLSQVHFMGAVPQSQLISFYRTADLFLSASEHEGFCIPLLESMQFDVPVLAYAAGAVPETLDGAGVLFHRKDPEPVAEMMGRLVSDPDLRAAVIERQRVRLARFKRIDVPAQLRRCLEPVLGSAHDPQIRAVAEIIQRPNAAGDGQGAKR
jgi:glycosyltransferase involved in cell wall biosynthesis